MICPYCGSSQVFRGSSLFSHVFRTWMDSKKRYCAGCKKRWQSRRSDDLGPRIYSIVLLGVLFIAGLFLMKFFDRHGALNGSFFRKNSGVQKSKNLSLSEENLLNERRKALELQKHVQFVKQAEKRANQ